jgi:1-hydroxycarotenoid 3,4-desaturase
LNSRKRKAVIIGAGVGGLACALDLALGGVEVTVLERDPGAGGKARTATVGGASIDAGPTVLTMTWVFEELFQAAGTSLEAEVPLERPELLARHTWTDGTRLDLYANLERSVDEIGRVFGVADARAYRAYCEDGHRMYDLSQKAFLRSQRPTVAGIMKQFGLAGLSALGRLDGHLSMWRSLERRFPSPRLRQLFGRYATYCGSSPFDAPATLNLIAHVERSSMARPRGGMGVVVAALERVGRRAGVNFLFGREVNEVLVEQGRAAGVRSGDERYAADLVVFNGDVSAPGLGLLGTSVAGASPVTPLAERSLSAVTWAILGAPTGGALVHHNVFFSDDYRDEFDALFHRSEVPRQPTVYVCAQDRGDPEISTERERLLVLINAPPTGDVPGRWGEQERQRCTDTTTELLRRAGLTISRTAAEQTTPADFHRRFPGTGGALYGPRSSGPMAILGRSPAASKIPGLYLAGGSVHPGAGVPMAALSGRLAASQARADLALTSPFPMAATSGTTSTG